LPGKSRAKPRAVIDTNVLVAGIAGFREPFRRGRNSSADLLRAWADKEHFVWLLTEEILDEYKAVLKRCGVRSASIGAVINLIRERAEMVEVRTSAKISPDPKDDAFCDCAQAGNANFILTLNLKDFPQEWLKAKVVPPEVFEQD
jgi:putative PIN family toxin of toxin-antitoxin system